MGPRFEARPNALHAVRLSLAISVVAFHCSALAGHSCLPPRPTRSCGKLPVDAFFAISGFLICRAWQRDSHPARFALARLRRVVPGLWACLVVTAFVIAPLSAAVAGQPRLAGASQWAYVLGNADTWSNVHSIDGSPRGLPSVMWNGSLWSLGYEMACYAAVLVLGALGRLPRSRECGAAPLSFWAWAGWRWSSASDTWHR